MKKTKFAAIVLALICAFAMMGLVACGGSSGGASSGSASSEQQAAPQPTDEELITADVKEIFGTALSADLLLEGLRADESMKNFEKMGLDLEKYAQNMTKIFKIDVTGVEVNGDTAVAKCALTIPDFGEKSNELTEKALEKASKGKDTSTLSQDEQIKIFGEVMNAVLLDPDFPTTTSDFDIDYVKKDGTWQMKDLDAFKNMLNIPGSTASAK